MKKIVLFLIIGLIISCRQNTNRQSIEGQGTTEKNTFYEASVRLNWIPSCSFVGEILGMEKYDDQNNLELTLESGGPGLDPIKLVVSGTNTFGVAGADLVLAANDKGADLVVIGLVSYDSPGVWLAKAKKNITSIESVHGKRIGELPGGNMQYLYEVFLKKTGLERNKDFTPVPIPFEIKNFIAQDECDLRPVFIYDETSELELRGIDYTLLEPKKFGIQFKGICYFTKRETVEKNPEMVQAFINTMALGWEDALKNPEGAIEGLKRFDSSIKTEKELIGLKKGLEYFKGYQNKVLFTDLKSWDVMAIDMLELGFLKEKPNLEKTLDLRFVNDFHSSK